MAESMLDIDAAKIAATSRPEIPTGSRCRMKSGSAESFDRPVSAMAAENSPAAGERSPQTWIATPRKSVRATAKRPIPHPRKAARRAVRRSLHARYRWTACWLVPATERASTP